MDNVKKILYSLPALIMMILCSATGYAAGSDTSIPEPGAGILLLLGSGLMVVAFFKKKKR